MTKPEPVLPDDLMWGAQAIADYINRPVRTVYYLIGKGILPATKLGPRTIVARASELDRAFSSDGAFGTKKSPPAAANSHRGGAR
jgi:hypothetical protein